MPTLREFLTVLLDEGQDIGRIEQRARDRWPETTVYIPQKRSRKIITSIGLRTEIVRAAQTEAVALVAKRYGITRHHVRRLVRRYTV
jgi:hypothetical protein